MALGTPTIPTNGSFASNTNAATYATAGSITFSPGSLYILVVGNRGTAATVSAPTCTGWDPIDATKYTQAFNSAASPLQRISVLRSMGHANGVQTVAFGGVTQANCYFTIFEISGTDTSGTNGAGAIVQVVSSQDNTNAGSGHTETLAAFGSTNNMAVGALGYAAAAAQSITPANSFTEIDEQSASGAEVGKEQCQYKLNDTSVQWTTSNTSGVAGIAFEVQEAVVSAAAPTGTLAAMGVG